MDIVRPRSQYRCDLPPITATKGARRHGETFSETAATELMRQDIFTEAHLHVQIKYDDVMARWAKLGPLALMIGAALFCGRPAWAHHAFASTFTDKTVTIEGRVVEFLFRSPHSVILVETLGEKRQPIVWAAEWGTAGQLSRQGIEKDTLKPGDHVIVTGNPSRNTADRRLRIVDITRPSDGWGWGSNYP